MPDNRNLSEKFFSERELRVELPPDKDEKTDSAQEWFDAVSKVLDTLPIYEHDNFGHAFPRRQEKKGETHVWFYRGQKDIKFAFTSKMYRFLFESVKTKIGDLDINDLENYMSSAEKKLLSEVGEWGIGLHLTGLERLSLLQHYGAPTRLLDVSTDWKVALFFATEEADRHDGRLFLIRICPDRWLEFPKAVECPSSLVWGEFQKNFGSREDKETQPAWTNEVWPVLTPFSDPRMISQKGYFLVGGIPSHVISKSLRTSKCNKCKKKLCSCPDAADYSDALSETLNSKETRELTSLTVHFGSKLKKLNQIETLSKQEWSCIGYSILVPGSLKEGIRGILRSHGIHKESIYPNLSDKSEEFEEVVRKEMRQASENKIE